LGQSGREAVWPEATTRTIRRIFAEVPTLEKAVIYGSRAKGNYRPGSDIDLALFGPGLDWDMLGKIAAQLEESPIPYQVDLTLFEKLDNASLRDHIKRVGQLFYQRQWPLTPDPPPA
jgi:predicted nucleotidyltransferase